MINQNNKKRNKVLIKKIFDVVNDVNARHWSNFVLLKVKKKPMEESVIGQREYDLYTTYFLLIHFLLT